MRNVIIPAATAAVLLGIGFLGAPSQASATTAPDGHWSVLIITDKGECDRAYRYALKVANGHVSYDGNGGVKMAGTVAPNGLVNVSIKLGDKGASGTGHLDGSSGSGTWRGIGATQACSGRWEAERR